MSGGFKDELDTIFVLLKGSRWAAEPEIVTVIEEFGRLVDATARLRHLERRASLQIFYCSRAMDSLLEYIVNREALDRGAAPPGNVPIGVAINMIRGYLDPWLIAELESHVRDNRNDYLHTAGIFPSAEELEMFILASAIGISNLVDRVP